MAKHTPGPWYVDGDHCILSGLVPIAICSSAVAEVGLGEADANARLIAMAPELLKSLDSLIKELSRQLVLETIDLDPETEKAYHAAIAAYGRSI